MEITHPDDRSADLEGGRQLGRGKIPAYQTEKRYIRKDGTLIWAEVKVILVRDPHGHPLHALAVISDITERKLLQTKRAEHASQLQHERNFIDTILNTVAALIMVVDPEGRLVRFNAAYNTTTGHDFAEFVGAADWQNLIPPEEREGVNRAIDRLLAGEECVVQA